MISLIPYIGGKHRIAKQIAVFLQASGADTLVDVFGGSAAVLLNSGFRKRIYNDADGDLVNLFRVLADPPRRTALIDRLQFLPASRRVFEADHVLYVRNGFSFRTIEDSVERARATFYQHQFSYGGKARSGGFVLSTEDRGKLKEPHRYQNGLRRLQDFAAVWGETGIENLHYSDCIKAYGQRRNCVLFCDPPYVGTEHFYSYQFCRQDHAFLANQLAGCRASVVCTYYDEPLVRALYPESHWTWHPIASRKNMQRFAGTRRVDGHWKGQVGLSTDWVLVRKGGCTGREPRATGEG